MTKRSLIVTALVSFAALEGCDDPARPVVEDEARPEREDASLSQRGAGLIPNHYIVAFNDEVADPPGVARGLARAHGLELRHTYSNALKGFAAVVPPGRLDALRADPRVRYVTPDRVDELHQQGDPTVPTGIDRIEGDLNTAASGPVDADIAILDTGIDLDHPDLNVVRSVSFVGRDAEDELGHGTHVAGTAAANGAVVGVAPGARLWAVKVCDKRGSCRRSNIIAGIDYVTVNAGEIEVANMSLGGRGEDDGNCGETIGDPEHEAICRAVAAGVVFVVSAGNAGRDAAGYVPASYDEVITVSALADLDGQPGGLGESSCSADADDSFADFSNFGDDVDLMAPGVCIYSTWMDGGYNTINGTSMAAPHVTGAVALYAAARHAEGIPEGDYNGDRSIDVRDVDHVHSVLRSTGILQTDEDCGLVERDDPDGSAERIVFANALALDGDGSCGDFAPTYETDIAVAGIAAPSVAALDAVIEVPVTVRNPGTHDVLGNIPITVVSDNATAGNTDDDLLIGTETITGLPAGYATTLVLSWNTASANGGTHTLTASLGSASAPFTDDNGTNDAATASVEMSRTMHVANLDRASLRNGGGTWTARVRIWIDDSRGAPLDGAVVTGTWSHGITGTSDCTTKSGDTEDGWASGFCEVDSPPIPNKWGNVIFTVEDAVAEAYLYDASGNTDPDGNTGQSDGTTIRVFFSNSDDYLK